jgi:single-stranded-DNA-specific exonuclease
LVRHGGHAMAAGLTIQSDKVDSFRERMNHLARRAMKPETLQPPLRLDAEVALEELNFATLGELNRLVPTGQGNPQVNFTARGVTHQKPLQRIGAEKQHVKMWVNDGTATHEAVWWRAGNESLPVGKFDLAFAPQINQFNGSRSIQLKVLDWRSAQ